MGRKLRGPPAARRDSKKPPPRSRDAADFGLLINACAVLLDWCKPFVDEAPKASKVHKDFKRLSPEWAGLRGPQRVHYEVEPSLAKPEQGAAARSESNASHGASLNSSGFGRDAEDEEAELNAAIEDSIRQEEERQKAGAAKPEEPDGGSEKAASPAAAASSRDSASSRRR